MPRHRPKTRPRSPEAGYIMLIFLVLLAMMVIAMMAAAPRLAQQLKRDREIELMHRGDQYARAIKKYYKKFGRYPGRMEDLEKANNIRFLRKRYTDPMNGNAPMRLVRFGEVQFSAGATVGTPAGQLGQAAATLGGAGSRTATAQTLSQAGSLLSGLSTGTGTGLGTAATGITGSGSSAASDAPPNTGTTADTANASGSSSLFGGSGSSSLFGSSGSSGGSSGGPGSPTGGASGSLFSPSSSGTGASSGAGSPAGGGQTFGGAPIIGVASLSKQKGIHEFPAGKDVINKWLFLYDPAQDRGQLLRGPYDPKAYFGNYNQQQANPNTGTQTTGSPGMSPSRPTGTTSIFGGSSSSTSSSNTSQPSTGQSTGTTSPTTSGTGTQQ